MNTTPRRIAILVASLFLTAAGQAAAATTYRSVELGQADQITSALALNNHGQVVGSTYVDSGVYGYEYHATLWDKTRTVDLEGRNTLASSRASSINDAGQIAGGSYHTGGGNFTVRWDGARTSYVAGGVGSAGINNAGTVAGESNYRGGEAIVWRNGEATRTALNGLSVKGHNAAVAINDVGQVVGTSSTSSDWSGPYHATRWDGLVATDLGSFGAENNSAASDINNAGQVVGKAQGRAVIWNGHTIRDLGTLGRGDYSANAINEAGLVVGRFNTGVAGPFDSYQAILWNGSAMVDLNSLLDPALTQAGWVLSDATGINDRGDIVGNMVNRYTFLYHGVLLSAVPEADTYAMLLAGLGMLGFMARRRRAA
jgi:probable HAF family extracellular repeat protein